VCSQPYSRKRKVKSSGFDIRRLQVLTIILAGSVYYKEGKGKVILSDGEPTVLDDVVKEE
jgi:hypothetical protein